MIIRDYCFTVTLIMRQVVGNVYRIIRFFSAIMIPYTFSLYIHAITIKVLFTNNLQMFRVHKCLHHAKKADRAIEKDLNMY